MSTVNCLETHILAIENLTDTKSSRIVHSLAACNNNIWRHAFHLGLNTLFNISDRAIAKMPVFLVASSDRLDAKRLNGMLDYRNERRMDDIKDEKNRFGQYSPGSETNARNQSNRLADATVRPMQSYDRSIHTTKIRNTL